MNEVKPTSVRVPADLLKRLRISCAEHEVLQQDAINKGIELWLEHLAREDQGSTREPISAVTPVSRYAPANTELHDKLETILNSGDEMTIATVGASIELFYSRLKPASARRKSGS